MVIISPADVKLYRYLAPGRQSQVLPSRRCQHLPRRMVVPTMGSTPPACLVRLASEKSGAWANLCPLGLRNRRLLPGGKAADRVLIEVYLRA